ncbi:Mitotic spindle checkpoint component mad2 [Ascosphaera aggregata]|nr:Mitotic spindle checkpoint component mad2 [Ascosphaera aggregata]
MPPKPSSKSASSSSKTHRLTLKGSAKLISEFVRDPEHVYVDYGHYFLTAAPSLNTPSIPSCAFQRGVYPPEDFTAVKKYGLNMLVTSDDQVKAYIKRIMSQLNRWMLGGKISKLVVVITDKDTGDVVERWQFDVSLFGNPANPTAKSQSSNLGDGENAATQKPSDPPTSHLEPKTEKQVQEEIQAIFRQITASVTFLPVLDGNCTFNVLVYADADSDVPVEWGDSDAKEIKNGEKVQLRSFSTSNHRVDTLVSYSQMSVVLRYAEGNIVSEGARLLATGLKKFRHDIRPWITALIYKNYATLK